MKSQVPQLLLERIAYYAKHQPQRKIIWDSSGYCMSNIDVECYSTFLAKRIQENLLPEETYIGILLPTCAPAVLVVLAILKQNKIPVFLNYSSSKESIAHALKKCSLRTLVTQQSFLQRTGITFDKNCIFIENLLPSGLPTHLPSSEKNPFWESNRKDALPSNIATVIFSSGSTGIPKGVLLSHHNLNENTKSILQQLHLTEKDRIVGSLPLFHSFGFLATFWLPLYQNIPVVYSPDPIDGEQIGKSIREQQCTILFATPTFLQVYLRKCSPDQLETIRIIITGAEKLRQESANKFYQKFRILPVEGYGCTELSPVVSINLPEKEFATVQECGSLGSVGKPLPGVTIRIIDPTTKNPVPEGCEGILMVKGANVMKGYLGDQEKTEQVIRNGWYNTGDIARVDEKNYLYITGRISRFSKIGGEMIPHEGIEDAIHYVLNIKDERVLVVTGIPHKVKGELLVVLHLQLKTHPAEIVSMLREHGLPNLWIPKVKNFHPIDNIPILGSGKLHLASIRNLAQMAVKNIT